MGRWHAAVIVLLFAAPVRAEPPARDPVAAEALFRRGRASFKRGAFESACKDFAESLHLDPAVGTELNLSECEENIGRIASAWQHLQEAIALLDASDGRLAIARERLAKLDARVPRLIIRPSQTLPDGSTVTRDNVELGPRSLGSAQPVDPGEHVVGVRAPGHEDVTFRVQLADGEHKTLEVTLGTVKPTTVAKSDPSPVKEGPRWPAIIVGSSGVALTAVGLVLGAVASSDLSDSKQGHCGGAVGQSDPNRCDSTGLELRDNAGRLADVSTALVITGIVTVAAGTVLLLWPAAKRSANTRWMRLEGTF